MNTPQLILRLRRVDHDQLDMLVDLGRGQTNARRGVHGLGHVGDQLAQSCVERGDRPGHGAQARVGIFEDGELGQGLLSGGPCAAHFAGASLRYAPVRGNPASALGANHFG